MAFGRICPGLILIPVWKPVCFPFPATKRVLDFGNLMFTSYSQNTGKNQTHNKDDIVKYLATMSKGLFVAAITGWLIIGCVSSRSGEVYSREDAGRAQTVVTGSVESVREVLIEGTKTPVGTVVGGVAGGVLGSTVGSGAGKKIATVLGSLAGAAAGTAAEEGLHRKAGLESFVKQDNGQTIVVVQEADVLFAPGDRVRIITAPNGTTRVSK